MENYINKVVEKMQEDCESFANIEWVKSILAEMSQLSYEAGQQSQQAKVEEQAQEIANLKSLIQGHELRHQQNLSIKQKLTKRSDELQKRVDAVEQVISKIRNGNYASDKEEGVAKFIAGMLEQALKGGEDE